MAKKEEKPAEKKMPKKHLHSVRMEVLRDHEGKPTGKFIQHESHLTHPRDMHPEPERPVNAHNSPEEAGQAAQERLEQAMGGGAGGAEEAPEEAGGEPGAAGAMAGGGGAPSPMG